MEWVIIYLIGMSALAWAASALGEAREWWRVLACVAFIALWPVAVPAVLLLSLLLYWWWPLPR